MAFRQSPPKILKDNKMCERMAYRDVGEPGAARVTSEEMLGKQHHLPERRHVIAALGSWHLHLCVGWYKPYVGFLSLYREAMCKWEVYTGFSGCEQFEQGMLQTNNLPNTIICTVMLGCLIVSTKMRAYLSSESHCAELPAFTDVLYCEPLCLPRLMQEKFIWVK